MKYIIKFVFPCLSYLMMGGHMGENMGVGEQILYGKHRNFRAFFSFVIFGVREIVNRIFHNDLKLANMHEVFVLLYVFSR